MQYPFPYFEEASEPTHSFLDLHAPLWYCCINIRKLDRIFSLHISTGNKNFWRFQKGLQEFPTLCNVEENKIFASNFSRIGNSVRRLSSGSELNGQRKNMESISSWKEKTAVYWSLNAEMTNDKVEVDYLTGHNWRCALVRSGECFEGQKNHFLISPQTRSYFLCPLKVLKGTWEFEEWSSLEYVLYFCDVWQNPGNFSPFITQFIDSPTFYI